MEEYKCRYCIHQDYKKRKCTCTKECLIFGSNAFSQFEEVDQLERKTRERYFETDNQTQKKQKRSDAFYSVLTVISAAVVIISVAVLVIASLVYRFSNLELTETQIMIWIFEHFWYLIVLISLTLCLNFVFRK